jgi:hypothetical protein
MRKRLLVAVPVAVAALGILGWRLVAASSKPTEDVIAVSGRIEGDDAAVAAKNDLSKQQNQPRATDGPAPRRPVRGLR